MILALQDCGWSLCRVVAIIVSISMAMSKCPRSQVTSCPLSAPRGLGVFDPGGPRPRPIRRPCAYASIQRVGLAKHVRIEHTMHACDLKVGECCCHVDLTHTTRR